MRKTALLAVACVLSGGSAFALVTEVPVVEAPLMPAISAMALPTLPTPAALSAEMRLDAVALGRPFKTMDWRAGEPSLYGERDPSRIHQVQAGPQGRAVLVQGDRARPIAEGEKLIYVMLANGTMEAGTRQAPRIDFDRSEHGVKHMQVADGRETVFAGELTRKDGTLELDLDSGGFSQYGLDPRWAYTAKNRAMLRRYAQKILGEPVKVPRRTGTLGPMPSVN